MRTIDRILELVDTMEGLSPTEREVLRYRIEKQPSHAEMEEARVRLAPPAGIHHGWENFVHPPTRGSLGVDLCGTEY